MREYYMYYYRDFANTYALLYAEDPDDFEAIKGLDADQITRKEAEHRARENKALNSQFASQDIMPAHIYFGTPDRCPYNYGYKLRGVIWEQA